MPQTSRSPPKPDSDPPPGRLVHEALQESWGDYLRRRRRFRKHASRKSVHRLRTAIRRLSSRLDLAAAALAPKAAGRLRKLLAREARCLAKARDLQAQQKRLARRRPGFLDWPGYRRHLEKRAKKTVRRATKRLERWGTGKQRRVFGKIDRALTERFAGAGPSRQERLVEDLRNDIGSVLRSVERRKTELRPGDHRSFHKLRQRLKDLAFKSEMARPLVPLPRGISVRLPRLERSLGRIQDQAVFLESARGYFRKGKPHAHPHRELERALVKRESTLVSRSFRRPRLPARAPLRGRRAGLR